MRELEQRLRDLGAQADWPPTPDLAAALAVAPPRRRSARRGRARRRVVAVVAAALLLVPAAALAVPGPRHAILDALGLRHVTVQRGDRAPARGADPRLGRPVAAAHVPRIAGFTPLAPTVLGAPDRAYVLRRIVTYVYDRPHLLLAQASGTLQREVLLKMVQMDDRARAVRVGADAGLWLARPHLYGWTDATGPPVRSGAALIWEHGDRVLRLEGARSLRDALRIAVSVG